MHTLPNWCVPQTAKRAEVESGKCWDTYLFRRIYIPLRLFPILPCLYGTYECKCRHFARSGMRSPYHNHHNNQQRQQQQTTNIFHVPIRTIAPYSMVNKAIWCIL